MPTMTQFNTHLDAARGYIGTGDYDAAETEVLQAQACLAAFPDGQGEGLGSRVEWRDTLDKLLARIDRLRARAVNTAGGVQRQKFRFVGETDPGDGCY